MMKPSSRLLSPQLEAVLSDVHVRSDCLSATVLGRTVTADTSRALTGQVASALYTVAHVGRPARESPTPRPLTDVRDLETVLARGVPHEHSRYRGSVLSGPKDRDLVVSLSGLRVRVPLERVAALQEEAGRSSLAMEQGAHDEVIEILVAATRPLLSPGFFLVDGSLPLTRQDAVLRVYLHVETSDAALDAWGRTLRCLEDRGVPYRAKAASSTDALPRRDGIVVYLGSREQHVLPHLVKALSGVALGADTSAFTRPLAPGIAVAWEPDDSRSGMRNTSFGEHRSRVIAEGLIQYATDATAEAGEPRPDRSTVIRRALLAAGIDPLDPARNLSSPPFPPPGFDVRPEG
ncbi:T3SS effector HopA1 family protein [Streptomyces sp. NPDC002640]